MKDVIRIFLHSVVVIPHYTRAVCCSTATPIQTRGTVLARAHSEIPKPALKLELCRNCAGSKVKAASHAQCLARLNYIHFYLQNAGRISPINRHFRTRSGNCLHSHRPEREAIKHVSFCISGQRRLDVSDCFAITLRRTSEASPLECRPIRPLFGARRHANAQVFRFAALYQI